MNEFDDENTVQDVVDKVSLIVNRIAGIQLGRKQAMMVENRLRTRILKLGLNSFRQYFQYLSQHQTQESAALLSLLTTHHSYFFRESNQFDILRTQLLPRLLANGIGSRHRPIKIWSAACSRGQEAYTIAMVLDAYGQETQKEIFFEILGTDVDGDSVKFAQNGVYSNKDLKEVPKDYFARYFSRGRGSIAEFSKIRNHVKQHCHFTTHNLANPSGSSISEKFDFIFCRNLFIYFNNEMIIKIICHLNDHLISDGYLFIGVSESLAGLDLELRRFGPSIYQLGRAVKNLQVVQNSPKRVLQKSVNKTSHESVSAKEKMKVLIVDDSPSILKILSKIINDHPKLEVVDTCTKPLEALDQITSLKPDVITLDIGMPVMNGVELLKEIRKKHPIPVVMISAMSPLDGPLVLEALELGAFDYIKKPNLNEVKDLTPYIQDIIISAAKSKPVRRSNRMSTPCIKHVNISADSLVLIGSSTGGTEALKRILSALPKNIPPILIVQHMPQHFTRAFAERLNQLCPFQVKEASQGDKVQPGCVYIAPGGQHMEIREKFRSLEIQLLNTEKVNHHVPSIDVLFRSALPISDRRMLALILTGMGRDGAAGLLELKKKGATTFAQNEESSVVYGMPREAVALGAAEQVYHLDDMASHMIQWFEEKSKKSA
ncbi:MAG: chemotaxis-specific protein-glutamate methyltransferase CheB [Oligoflexus sp.]